VARKLYARRYAQAAFEIALAADELPRWQADLGRIARLVEDKRLAALLENPKLGFDAKARLLSEVIGEVSPLVLNLVYLLITRGRLGIVGDITAEFQRLLDSHQGTEQAKVITAVPLDEEDRQKISQRLSAITGKKVVLEAEVDPGLVGGFTARIGGKLLDGSTRSRLAALKRELSRGGK